MFRALLVSLVFAWTGTALALEPIPLLSPRVLIEKLQSGETVHWIDVREAEEFAENHLPGAINIPQGQLAERRDEIPKQGLVIPYCNMDFRGFVAARELQALGAERVALMQERGIRGWAAQGLPLVSADSGLSDAAALEQLHALSAEELLGDRLAASVPPTGVVHKVRIEAGEWFFEPNDLAVRAGDRLELELRSSEGDHFFVLPDYELSVELPEGETRHVAFLADRAGDYRFGSCEWDGGALQVMKGRLRVSP